ncbi:two-component system, OmpR family, sensor histidine kinase QseC [Pasteurella testudinis DSM 23072]|uniref:Sensor protein QseC n=1 Tax=Pasteurella testudinis DSM 23072 TaxID=1122938 RepID=A0A1W1USR5_9PAST|nr:quorum sensing histidine kinase QseC [Pasteurella testudinis]SMB84093.1 two-component system, OmpR family, sensor histidine kinase QseC [Pasteurella testudinis DSM 23072]SUB50909.1 sensor protein QseC [Pasteurella testudinis]
MKINSLRLRLIIILSFTSLLLWCVAGIIAWSKAKDETDKVFDAQQILFAQRLATSNLRQILIQQHNGKMPEAFKPPRHIRKKVLDDDALAFAIFTRQGERVLSDGNNGDHITFSPTRGFAKQTIDDDSWRIFWLPAAGGELMIAVGQELEYREDIVSDMVFSQLWVWLAGLPVLLALIAFVVSRELAPLKRLRQELHHRSPDDNSPIEIPSLPSEIQPVVNSLNHFFDRTSSMLLRERRFTSDAAHELRSPLTALRVQTEIAQLAGDDSTMRDQALNHLTHGIDRATQLIEQLLTLSRLDSVVELDNQETIKWQDLVESLLGERYFAAAKKQIALEFQQHAQPPLQQGQPLLISLMLRNLIDNAIHYCPNGSRIVVSLYRDRITVSDNGNGVAPDDLLKLGQRFYRPAGQNEKGSGLGLSIVNRIAELHHYSVKFRNIIPKGFESEIRFE